MQEKIAHWFRVRFYNSLNCNTVERLIALIALELPYLSEVKKRNAIQEFNAMSHSIRNRK